MTLGELVAHTHTVAYRPDASGGGGGGVLGLTDTQTKTSSSTGSTTPFNVIQPTSFLNLMIKL
jgi:hypothetical protein